MLRDQKVNMITLVSFQSYFVPLKKKALRRPAGVGGLRCWWCWNERKESTFRCFVNQLITVVGMHVCTPDSRQGIAWAILI